MNSCEMPGAGQGASASSRQTEKGSRVHRFQQAKTPAMPNLWLGVPVQGYKQPADHHCGVSRAVIVGDSGEQTKFHLRYFEIAPNGFTTLEHHQHEHVVLVQRGRGEIRLGEQWHEVGFGDAIYVAPNEVHQLRNRQAEPFGFFCVVDAQRDAPVAVQG